LTYPRSTKRNVGISKWEICVKFTETDEKLKL